MNILDFQENIDTLWSYWLKELLRAERWTENHEGWIRCHPEKDIASRKGYIRTTRAEKKRREGLIEHFKKRILYCKSMLREISHEVSLENEKLFSTN